MVLGYASHPENGKQPIHPLRVTISGESRKAAWIRCQLSRNAPRGGFPPRGDLFNPACSSICATIGQNLLAACKDYSYSRFVVTATLRSVFSSEAVFCFLRLRRGGSSCLAAPIPAHQSGQHENQPLSPKNTDRILNNAPPGNPLRPRRPPELAHTTATTPATAIPASRPRPHFSPVPLLTGQSDLLYLPE